MRKYIFILLTFLSISSFAQKQINLNLQKYVSTNYVLQSEYTPEINAINLSIDSVKNLVMNGFEYDSLVNKPYVDVADFGAYPDDGIYDGEYILTAIEYARDSNLVLNFGTGTYDFNDKLSITGFTKNSGCYWIGNNVLFDFTDYKNTSTQACILLMSDTTDRTDIDSDLSIGDTVITSTLASSLLRNDIVYLKSTDYWSPSRVEYTKGELCKVKKISGSDIILYEPLYDSYSAATTDLLYMDAATLNIEGIKIKGRGNIDTLEWGLVVKYFRDININSCEFGDCEYIGLDLQFCYGGNIFNNTTYETTFHGNGYGIDLVSCQNFAIYGNRFTGARHGLSITGGHPSRGILVYGNTFAGTQTYYSSLDTHESCEDIIISGNYFLGGGINIRGRNVTVQNNTFIVDDKTDAAIALTAISE